MARRFKVGDKIRLKPHTELGLTEYTWGTIIVEDIDPNNEYVDSQFTSNKFK